MKISIESVVSRLLILITLLTYALTAVEPACRCCSGSLSAAETAETLPAPTVRDGIGTLPFPLSTKSPHAKLWVERGIAYLHAFWELEAARAFHQALKLDPNCAMAYWGLCMSMPGKNLPPDSPRSRYLAKAKELSANASLWEKAHISALDALLNQDTNAALKIYNAHINQNPDDLDALAFSAYWIRDGWDLRTGKPNQGTAQGLTLLNIALKKNPQHCGAMHYLIHLFETGPEYEKMQPIAEKLTQIAPAAPHYTHMPGHLAYLRGDYQTAINIFSKAGKQDSTWLSAEKIHPCLAPNYIHNQYFLALCQYEITSEKDHSTALATINAINTLSIPASLAQEAGSQYIDLLCRSLPIQFLLRDHQFSEAKTLAEQTLKTCSPAAQPYLQFLATYAHCRQLLLTGKAQEIPALLPSMQTLTQQLNDRKENALAGQAMPFRYQAADSICLFQLIRCLYQFQKPNNPKINEWIQATCDVEQTYTFRDPPPVITCISGELSRELLRQGKLPEALATSELANKLYAGNHQELATMQKIKSIYPAKK